MVVRDGVETGARPGTILRSGRDTQTVPLESWLADIRAAGERRARA